MKQKENDEMDLDEEGEGEVELSDFEKAFKKYELFYRVSETSTGTLVTSIFEQHRFGPKKLLRWNILWTGRHLKLIPLQNLNEHQRVNHFPHTSEITRKNELYKNFFYMQRRHGKEQYDFVPYSFQFPDEYDLFLEYHESMGGESGAWILKPSMLSRGRGIYLITQPEEIEHEVEEEPYVCCQYIDNPFLINGLKFDLRIYVCVTSFLPLRVYVYEDGLARFATEKYKKGDFSNAFKHITNYSINKLNKNFVFNTGEKDEATGGKWSLRAFKRHIRGMGENVGVIFSRIHDVIIKTLLSIEEKVVTGLRNFIPYRSNCFELFGFDILIDEKRKPHLLEVNLSPSLGARYPIDFRIKMGLLTDMFNMIRVVGYDRENRVESSKYSKTRVPVEIMTESKDFEWEDDYEVDFSGLKSAEKYTVRETLDEIKRKGDWNLIYPSKDSEKYDQFFQQVKSVNTVLRKTLFK